MQVCSIVYSNVEKLHVLLLYIIHVQRHYAYNLTLTRSINFAIKIYFEMRKPYTVLQGSNLKTITLEFRILYCHKGNRT